MSHLTMNPEVTEMIIEAGGEDLKACYHCGTCTGSCPWGYLSGLGVRQMIRMAQFGLEGFEGEDLWKCVTCQTCVTRCPRGVEIVDVIRSMRSILVELEQLPKSLRTVLNSLDSEGNPWLESRKNRGGWMAGVDVKEMTDTTGYLLFTGCTPAYDPRTQKVARSLVRVLGSAGVDFGVLGFKLNCCGDAAHKIGNPELFQALRESNTEVFRDYDVKKILTISPHCYKAFRELYDLEDVEVVHHTELLAELLDRGDLVPKKPVESTVTYHDPCYLGRASGVYDAPRKILRAIPGLTLREMPRSGERSYCCGGGGGGAWRETERGDRLAEERLREALELDPEEVVTACPFCVLMLEDGSRSLDKDEVLKISDVVEVLEKSL